MDVVWTEEARASFEEIIAFIHRKFSQREVDNFIMETISLIESIKDYPQLFPSTELKALRKSRRAVIHPNTTLYYLINNENKLVLLLFWDNRKDDIQFH